MRAWLYLLCKARWEDGYEDEVLIRRGQCLISRKIAGIEGRVSAQTWRTALAKFEEWGMVTRQLTRAGELITLCNFETYQSPDSLANQASNQALTRSQPGANQALTRSQPGNKQRKQEKQLNKETRRGTFVPPSVSEVSDYCQERGNKIDAEHFVDHYEARGWCYPRGQKMKDWKSAVRTWEKNSFGVKDSQSKVDSKLKELFG